MFGAMPPIEPSNRAEHTSTEVVSDRALGRFLEDEGRTVDAELRLAGIEVTIVEVGETTRSFPVDDFSVVGVSSPRFRLSLDGDIRVFEADAPSRFIFDFAPKVRERRRGMATPSAAEGRSFPPFAFQHRPGRALLRPEGNGATADSLPTDGPLISLRVEPPQTDGSGAAVAPVPDTPGVGLPQEAAGSTPADESTATAQGPVSDPDTQMVRSDAAPPTAAHVAIDMSILNTLRQTASSRSPTPGRGAPSWFHRFVSGFLHKPGGTIADP